LNDPGTLTVMIVAVLFGCFICFHYGLTFYSWVMKQRHRSQKRHLIKLDDVPTITENMHMLRRVVQAITETADVHERLEEVTVLMSAVAQLNVIHCKSAKVVPVVQ
jgi:hypothetical protein